MGFPVLGGIRERRHDGACAKRRNGPGFGRETILGFRVNIWARFGRKKYGREDMARLGRIQK